MSDPFDLSQLDEPAPASADAARTTPERFDRLERLNPEQRAAVETLDGPVLVLAGAGTGKTRVLTTRLAHILATGAAWPSQILAVTFTNKAAREMADRVERLTGHAIEGMWLGTFHAMAARILRGHAELVGLKPNFTIIDMDDQVRLLKQVLAAHNVDEKRWPARALSTLIQRWKDRGLTPEKAIAEADTEFAAGKVLDLYRDYQERQQTLNTADFGDLLLHNLMLFTEHHEVLEEYRNRFHYILVDEYQDANVAQYLWLRLLAQGRQNLCCVGDDDQSIYGWRGAEVANILRFETDFPGAAVIRLERNYRSTGHILGAASGLIDKNEGRLGKTLWTEDEAGEKITVTGLWDGKEEARHVSEAIEALQRKTHPLREIAILVRASHQTRAFEERFLEIGLPYRVIGGLRFYERQEIRDAVAYIRMLVQPDDGLAFERIVNLPKRGLGDASLQVIHRTARSQGLALGAAAALVVETDELRPAARSALAGLMADFERWRVLLGDRPHPEVVEIVLDESGYTEMWQRNKSVQAPGRLENLKELILALEEFDTLDAFLEHVSLVMELAENRDEDMVNIMTLHAAKGLEFDTVFLPGWEEGVFPHPLHLDEAGAAGLEEERRLAYVGLTRAAKNAHILWAANRLIHNQWLSNMPSRFIDELPGEHVEHRAADGFPAGGPTARGRGSAGGSMFDGLAATGPHARKRAGRTLEGESYQVARRDEPERALPVGLRVFHQKFGYGKILSVDGNKLEIEFEKAGRKKVIDSFVEPA